MRKIALSTLIFICSITFTHAEGETYMRSVENNYESRIVKVFDENNKIIRTEGDYNLNSKRGSHKLFPGNINAKIEFMTICGFAGINGLRLIDSLGKHTLEVTNNPYPRMSDSIQDKRYKYHQENSYYNVISTISIPISDKLAEKLYERTVQIICTYEPHIRVVSSKEECRYKVHCSDGGDYTFRSVIGDDLWSLNVNCPMGGDAARLANVLDQIIYYIQNNSFDETKFIKWLVELEVPQYRYRYVKYQWNNNIK